MTTLVRKLPVVCVLAMMAAPLAAQVSEEEELRRFAEREAREFRRFVAKEDSAFASFLEKEWREYQAFASGSAYKAPKLVAPPVVAPLPAPAPAPRGPKPGLRVTDRPATPTRKPVAPTRGPKAPPVAPLPAAPPADTSGETIIADIPTLPPMPAPRLTGTPGHRPAPLALIPTRDTTRPRPLPSTLRTAAVPFYGGPVPVRYTRSPIPTLARPVNGAAIAAFYKDLAAADWGILADELRAQSEALELDDYAYAQFVLRLGRVLAGDEARARLLTWYLLLKSNVDARVGHLGPGGALPEGTVVLLVPSSVMVYATPYYTLGGTKYYAVSLDAAPPPARIGSLFTYDGNYPGTPRAADLRIAKTPALRPEPEARTLTWKYGATTHTITVRADRAAVRYLEWFPQVDWDVWFGIRMSDAARQSLLPQLKPLIAGRSERDAANFLIRFVQTAFAYKTDGEQFGREKPLSVDETLLYPFSDCEDRSILYAALVRELMGLEVVGLLYPGHMATAVKFRQDTRGDAVVVGGERWIVSDPTYIGADVGNAMPQYKQVTPELVRIR